MGGGGGGGGGGVGGRITKNYDIQLHVSVVAISI